MGIFSKQEAAIQESGTIRRASGGASVTRRKRILQSGKSEWISLDEMPRTLLFRGLLTRKSNHKITPPGFTTRHISRAICFFTVSLRIEVKSVNCDTRSNELLAHGSWRASPTCSLADGN